MSYVIEMAQKGKNAWEKLVHLTTIEKNKILNRMADNLEKDIDKIIEANRIDWCEGEANGLTSGLLDRLYLDAARIKNMANGLRKVATLADPTGHVDEMWMVENGLQIGKKRVPIGLIGIIYESRPNVTSDAIGLCIKSGNAVILRGGKETLHTNKEIVASLHKALLDYNLPKECVQLIESADRHAAIDLMRCNEYVDLLIPRGGNGLIQSVIKHATVPVIETGTGNCHLYIDDKCDKEMALNIAINGKVSRPSVCNSLEKIIIHESHLTDFLPIILERFRVEGIEVKVDTIIHEYEPQTFLAEEEDWSREYLDKVIAIKSVKNIDEAISHINKYGSHHSDAIVTKDYTHAQQFLNQVHSAAVYVNASTRFTDGEEFGFGAEIGISTQKLHARGPMGLKELTTTKYIIYGNGQIR